MAKFKVVVVSVAALCNVINMQRMLPLSAIPCHTNINVVVQTQILHAIPLDGTCMRWLYSCMHAHRAAIENGMESHDISHAVFH